MGLEFFFWAGVVAAIGIAFVTVDRPWSEAILLSFLVIFAVAGWTLMIYMYVDFIRQLSWFLHR